MGMCAVGGMEPPEAPDYDDDDMWAACYPHKMGGSEYRPKHFMKAEATKSTPILDEVIEYTPETALKKALKKSPQIDEVMDCTAFIHT